MQKPVATSVRQLP